jgi:hypothetical protein
MKGTLIMNAKMFILLFISAFILCRCAAMNMNHYQDGKALGKDEMHGFISAGTGLSFHTDTTKLSEHKFEVETKRGPSSIFLGLNVRAGLSSDLDLGGELFTTVGSTGFKFFGKYEITDTLSRWGVALMPLIGFSFPWFDEEEDEENSITSDDEVKISGRTFILEMVIPMNYALSNTASLTFGPEAFLHYNFISQTSGKSADFKRKGDRTWISPGAFLGFHISKVRFEGSIVYLDQKIWMPFFGISYSPSQLIGDSKDKVDKSKGSE